MAIAVVYNQEEGIYTDKAQANRNFGKITGTITFDSSYPTGGEDLDLSGKLQKLDLLLVPTVPGYHFTYDYTNKKVLVYVITTGVEVANATNLSTLVARFIAFGRVR